LQDPVDVVPATREAVERRDLVPALEGLLSGYCLGASGPAAASSISGNVEYLACKTYALRILKGCCFVQRSLRIILRVAILIGKAAAVASQDEHRRHRLSPHVSDARLTHTHLAACNPSHFGPVAGRGWSGKPISAFFRAPS
jgi:hypothetical protein